MVAHRRRGVAALALFWCVAAAAAPVGGEATLLLALMVRDEAANLRANLPRLRSVADAVVCGIDDRSADDSAYAIVEALPGVPRWVYYFTFDGFGAGRSRVFAEAWARFPGVSHVLVLDPDWEAVRLVKAQLDLDHRTFLFKVVDRNGLTTRTMNWLCRHEAGLSFAHALHEQLVQPARTEPSNAKLLTWEFTEREVKGRATWHRTTEHGHSQSHARYLFDLSLLARDLEDLGEDDAHTLFYLGVTHLSALDALLGIGEHNRTAQTDRHVAEGVRYLERRLSPRVLEKHERSHPGKHEHTWAAMRWLGHAHHFSTRNLGEARAWYRRCSAYDDDRHDCATFLAKLCRDEGRSGEAFATAFPALVRATTRPAPAMRMVDNFYVQACTLPLEVGLSLLPAVEEAASRDGAWAALAAFGSAALAAADAACDDPTRRFITEPPASVAAARSRYAALGAASGCVARRDALAAADGDADAVRAMVATGLRLC